MNDSPADIPSESISFQQVGTLAWFWSVFSCQMVRMLTLSRVRALVATTVWVSSLPALLAGMTMSTDGVEAHPLPSTLELVALVTFSGLEGCLIGGMDLGAELVICRLAVPSRAGLAGGRMASLLALVLSQAIVAGGADRAIRSWTDPGSGLLVLSWPLVAGCLLSTMSFALIGMAVTVLLTNAVLASAVLLLTPVLLLPWVERWWPLLADLSPYSACQASLTGTAEGAAVGDLLIWSALAAAVVLIRLGRVGGARG